LICEPPLFEKRMEKDMENSELINNIVELVNKFDFNGTFVDCKRFGNGHINDTFLITLDCDGEQRKYILQRINHNVFKNPEQVMENIIGVTSYLRDVLEGMGENPDRRTLNVIKTKDGKGCFVDKNGSYWRALVFIDDAVSLELPESENDFFQSAVAFGEFQNMLDKYPAETLHETIPNFHNTPVRFETFLKAVERDASGRAKDVSAEIEFVKSRREFMSLLEDSYANGVLPKRVTHNDTKLNNVMLDNVTRKPVCVVDLDTIMPGYSVNDFGDSIRFGASTAAEDEKDLDKVHFSLKLFDVYAKGFLEGCGGILTDKEIEFLPVGAKMMTLECGMRFLTDYIDGDTYFKTEYADHNLVRCRTQFKLVQEMEAAWEDMNKIIAKYR